MSNIKPPGLSLKSTPPGLSTAKPPSNMVHLPPPPDIFKASVQGNKAAVLDCIRAGQSIHSEDEGQQTPFFLACAFGRVKLAKWLMETFPIRVNYPNKFGFTPLHIALIQSHNDILRLLINNDNVDINFPNNRGNTPLHSAVQVANIPAAHMLLNANADMTIKNNSGKTAMILTLMPGRALLHRVLHPFMPKEPIVDAVRHFVDPETFRREVQVLLDAGTNVNVSELDQNTALREALRSGVVDAVEVLLSFAGVDNIFFVTSAANFTFPKKTFDLFTECAISGESPIPCPLRCLTADATCRHVFDATSGIIDWLEENGKCPLCRQKIEFIQIMSKEEVLQWNDMETKLQNAIELEKRIRESQEYKNASKERQKELLKDLEEIKTENAFINRMYEPKPLQF